MASFCQHCGARLNRPGAAFCSACGQRQLPAAGAGPATVGMALPYSAAGPAVGAAPRLIIQEPGQASRTAPLAAGVTTIGRETDNTIVIQNPTVSRHHARHRAARD